jgi:hypothetical protein
VILNDIAVAALIGGIITLASLPLISRAFQPHGRHHPRRAVARAREEMTAAFWIRDLTPGRSLAGLRLRRDLRHWIRPERRLP